jgi:hypothetical protein
VDEPGNLKLMFGLKKTDIAGKLLPMKPLIVSQVIFSMSARVIIATNELKGVYMERMIFYLNGKL